LRAARKGSPEIKSGSSFRSREKALVRARLFRERELLSRELFPLRFHMGFKRRHPPQPAQAGIR